MKSRLFALILILGFIPVSCGRPAPEETILSFSGTAMGTFYRVKIATPDLDRSKIAEISSFIRETLNEIEIKMSHYRSDSEITAVNERGPEMPLQVSDDLFEVLNLSDEIHKSTGGAFDIASGALSNLWGFGPAGNQDPRVPPPEAAIKDARNHAGMKHLMLLENQTVVKTSPGILLDLSAIAKGYAADLIVKRLAEAEYHDVMVEIGGDVLTAGFNINHKPWRIGIFDPSPEADSINKIRRTVRLSGEAMATSGSYQNYFEYKEQFYPHILDPRSGRPVTSELISVTVIAPTCALADAAATSVFVLGPVEGLQWIEDNPDMECLLVLLHEDASVEEILSKGFRLCLD